MKKKLALWIALVVFSMTISNPVSVAFACHGGRSRAARSGSPAAAGGGADSAPVQSRGYVTYFRENPNTPWRSYGRYGSLDDAVQATQSLQSQGYQSFIR